MSAPPILIYADESCLGNQNKGRTRPGGAGGLVEWFHPERGWIRRDFWLAEADTTNNRMAIRSAILPLQALKRVSEVVFTSDSRYLVDGMTSWIHNWVRRDWQRKEGPLENVELWQVLYAVSRTHAVEWRWVKGHAGHARNEYANHLATRAAAQQIESGGLIPSGFAAWVEAERHRGRYRDLDLDDMPEAA